VEPCAIHCGKGHVLLIKDQRQFRACKHDGVYARLVQDIFRIMRRINQEDGVSMLLVEQNATLALDLATDAYVLETGQVVVSGPAESIRKDESVRRSYLGY